MCVAERTVVEFEEILEFSETEVSLHILLFVHYTGR